MSSAIVLLPSSIPCTCRVRRSLSRTPFLKLGNDALSDYNNNRKKKKKKLSLSWAALPFDLSPPPIDLDPLETLEVADLEVSEYGMTNTLDNDDEALDAVNNGVAVVDLSDYGRIRVGKIEFSFFTIKLLQTLNVLVKARGVILFL